jgi:hypothetical protein
MGEVDLDRMLRDRLRPENREWPGKGNEVDFDDTCSSRSTLIRSLRDRPGLHRISSSLSQEVHIDRADRYRRTNGNRRFLSHVDGEKLKPEHRTPRE